MTWIQTFSGAVFDLVNPQHSAINFGEIAIVLGRISRFNGHTKYPFSVAQHCVEGAHAIMRDMDQADAALAFLLHDAHEAYMGDIISPVVETLNAYGCEIGLSSIAFSSVIKRMKWQIDAAIFAATGLAFPPPVHVCNIVREYDWRMLRTERDMLMLSPPRPWADTEDMIPIYGCDLSWKSPECATAEWAALFCRFVDNKLERKKG